MENRIEKGLSLRTELSLGFPERKDGYQEMLTASICLALISLIKINLVIFLC